MTARIEARGRIVWAIMAFAVALSACGDTAQLTIRNDSDLVITRLLTRPCLSQAWDPDYPPLDPDRDRPDSGAISIPAQSTVLVDLAPGCHDIEVRRTDRAVDRARLMMAAGDSGHWTAFEIDRNDNWRCATEACE